MQRKKRNIGMLVTVAKMLSMLVIMESLFMYSASLSSFYEIMTNPNPHMVILEQRAAKILILSATITLCMGLIFFLPLRKKDNVIDKRCGFLIVASTWIVFSLFGSLPYIIGNYIPSITDAWFETMSAFTATGASAMPDVEPLPYGIALWRIMSEWIGGIGIIVIVLSIVPFAGGGGMALYSAEVTGPTKSKLSPRIKETANILLSVYVSLTVVYFLSYHFAGMRWFDALCYAFTTAATGGLAVHNFSASEFSPTIQYLIILFMTISGSNLLFIYYIFKRNIKEVLKSEELKVYLSYILIVTCIIMFITYSSSKGLEETFRNSLFQVVSILTSTGLTNTDYTIWQTGALVLLVLLMFSGAMSGSTTGGLKLVRVILLFKSARTNIKKSLHSNAFVPVLLNKKPVSEEVLLNVYHLFILYILSLAIGFLVLVFSGIGLEEAIVSSVSALSNIGLGFGKSGLGCFAHFPILAKWTMIILMYIGRLELITVFAVFTKSFWKR
ncbi:MAG: TrkH family potassium uptake protein [Bacteroidales bacterium]|nr:TrkH family potassium uptake protein [Bacteroidales bacterium]